MQDMLSLFCPFTSFITFQCSPNTHLLPVMPKYLHFKNSRVLSHLCPWASYSLPLEWISSHLDFFFFVSVTGYYLSFNIHFSCFLGTPKIFSKLPDLSSNTFSFELPRDPELTSITATIPHCCLTVLAYMCLSLFPWTLRVLIFTSVV